MEHIFTQNPFLKRAVKGSSERSISPSTAPEAMFPLENDQGETKKTHHHHQQFSLLKPRTSRFWENRLQAAQSQAKRARSSVPVSWATHPNLGASYQELEASIKRNAARSGFVVEKRGSALFRDVSAAKKEEATAAKARLEALHAQELEDLTRQHSSSVTKLVLKCHRNGQSVDTELSALLATQKNQLYYLRDAHRKSKRLLRETVMLQDVSWKTEVKGEDVQARIAAAQAAEEEEDDLIMMPVIRNSYVTPLRAVGAADSVDMLIQHYGHWVSLEEHAILEESSLVPEAFINTSAPTPESQGRVKWVARPIKVEGEEGPASSLASLSAMDGLDSATVAAVCSSGLLSSRALSDRLVLDAVVRYPHVYRVPDTWRKAAISRAALHSVIRSDARAVGLPSRMEVMLERRSYGGVQREAAQVSIESLLEDIEAGRSTLGKGSRYFPPTRARLPFSSYDSAIDWVRTTLGGYLAPGHRLPSLGDVQAAYQNGSAGGYDNWYAEFYSMISEATCGNREEALGFLSILATASPNSSVKSNVVNALLNFRALSQGSRPQWGSYPHRSLVNYLAGMEGAPAGPKVTCFMDNLVYPESSPCVTVDTHMQRWLLGRGHLSLSALEYAVLEDYFRTASLVVGEEATPHKFQAALWVGMAGGTSFKSELLLYVSPVCFDLPRPVPASRRGDALQLVRAQLLELGYLTRPPREPRDDPRGEVLRVEVDVFLPMREQTKASIQSTLAMRQKYAQRQGRGLLKEEEDELKVLQNELSALDAEGSRGRVEHTLDFAWWKRDQRGIALWLGAVPDWGDEDMTPEGDIAPPDPYFGDHKHFPGSNAIVADLCPPGEFWERLGLDE